MKKTYYAIKSGDRYKHFPAGNWNTELDATCLFAKKETAERKADIFADEIVEIELIDTTKETRHGKWVCAPTVDTDIWRACEYFNTKASAIMAAREAIRRFNETTETTDIEDIVGIYPDENEKIISFAVGQCSVPALPSFADTIIEYAQEDVYDQCGDAAETYLDDVQDLDKRELEKIIRQWFERNDYMPSCYTITNVEQISLEDSQ